MDTYKNEQLPKLKKRSPYADSPYECAYTEPAPRAEKPSGKGGRRKGRVWLALLIMVACCVGTAIGVSSIWQGRMDRMEAAMEDRFDALQEIYNESKKPLVPDSASQGQLTPSQVYAKNVDAVVAITCWASDEWGYYESRGSGFIISADGYIVTNHHVIDGAQEVEVTMHSGVVMPAEIVGSEPSNDVALLKVDGKSLPSVTIGKSNLTMVGEQVVVIGNTLGEFQSSLRVGYISAKDRLVDTEGVVINMFQTDAIVNSGDSGGPLFNMRGEVIGIITAKYSGDTENGVSIEGLGFAVPTDDVKGILDDLREFGYVTGAYMGVYVLDVDANAQYFGLPAGAFVDGTEPGMAASRAGMCRGDIIISVGGYDVDSVSSLTRVLRRFKAGDTTSVVVYRGGGLKYLTIKFDEKPVETAAPMPEDGDYDEWYDYFFNEG